MGFILPVLNCGGATRVALGAAVVFLCPGLLRGEVLGCPFGFLGLSRLILGTMQVFGDISAVPTPAEGTAVPAWICLLSKQINPTWAWHRINTNLGWCRKLSWLCSSGSIQIILYFYLVRTFIKITTTLLRAVLPFPCSASCGFLCQYLYLCLFLTWNLPGSEVPSLQGL